MFNKRSLCNGVALKSDFLSFFSLNYYLSTELNERGLSYCTFRTVSWSHVCGCIRLYVALYCLLRSSLFLVCLRIYFKQTVGICFLTHSYILKKKN